MDINTVVNNLQAEMQKKLTPIVVPLEEGIVGARLYDSATLYGGIVLVTDATEELHTSVYEGRYLGLTDDSLSLLKRGGSIVLMIATTRTIGERHDGIPARLQRIDDRAVPFLGVPADLSREPWECYEIEPYNFVEKLLLTDGSYRTEVNYERAHHSLICSILTDLKLD